MLPALSSVSAPTSSPSTSLHSSPPPPPPTVSLSPPDDSLPRRVPSKSSLRSSHSHPEDIDPDEPLSDQSLVRPSTRKRLSPGLAARLKLLDGNKAAAPSRHAAGAVGRIPHEHIKELDSLHQNLSVRIEKKGRAWHGLPLVNGDHKELPCCDSDQRIVLDDCGHPAALPHPQQNNALPAVSAPCASSPPERFLQPPVDLGPVDSAPHQEEEEDEKPVMAVVESSLAPVGPVADTPSDLQEQQPDFQEYLQSPSANASSEHLPPPPPKDDLSRPASRSSSTAPSDSNPRGCQQTTTKHAPFSTQFSQLMSLSLPEASSLEDSIATIPDADSAVKALTQAAEHIQIWIKEASGVVAGLDAKGNVAWALRAGREGLDGLDQAITRFESLVNIYVRAIENVHLREDIGSVNTERLGMIVIQMDSIIQGWAQIKQKLKAVKEQVELAMECDEMSTNVLGDVGAEVENLNKLIHEMEEKRNETMASSQEPGHSAVDISELETIVEESTSAGTVPSSKRLSIEPILTAPPTLDTPIIQTPQDDTNHSNLISLFARIQPLRASFDFLPMRLSMLLSRAANVFPTACKQLEGERASLEKEYKALEAKAENLRQELGEDRWILVFRGAGGQATKMFESVERSIGKLQEGLEMGGHLHSPATLAKKIESYEAKKHHYVPAIERVVSIIQKGVNDQRTVNGETIGLLSDMTSRMDALKASMRVMDSSLEEVNLSCSQQLRDSISTIVTTDSPATGSVIDTPGSSPASSVVMTPAMKGSSTPFGSSSRRGSSVSSAARTTTSKVRRYSGLPLPSSAMKSAIPKPSFTTPSKPPSTTPTPAGRGRRPSQPASSSLNNRPRWNGSTNTNDLDTGHTPWLRKRPTGGPPRTSRPSSTVPFASNNRRDLSVSPAPPASRSASRVSSRLGSRSPLPGASPTPVRSSLLDPPPYSKLRKPSVAESMYGSGYGGGGPRNRQSYAGPPSTRSVSHGQENSPLSPTKTTRPGTALGHSGGHRGSLLPLPKARSGRDSAMSNRSRISERPPWR